jgi:release factor glutamine methyltransferase
MSLATIRSLFFSTLENLYEGSEIESIFDRIASYLLNYSKIEIHQHLHSSIEGAIEKIFADYLFRLSKGEPLQYILGFTEFYNLNIRVDSRILIPRPETEFMVDLIVKENLPKPDLQIIDLCTGSGCIAISLAKALNNANMTAMDISEEALELALQNAVENNTKIRLVHDNLLNLRKKYKVYDLIVSNPPYVREMEKVSMHINVLNFEPETALFVPDSDPLLFYMAIATFGSEHLTERGRLYAEINEQLGEETKAVFLSHGFKHVEIKKDIRQKDRYLIAYL